MRKRPDPDSKKLYELVGRNLARRRREAKLSQTQLAQRCDLTRGSIANIECGNQHPTLHTLLSLARALQVDMRSFFPSPDDLQVNESSIDKSIITGRLKQTAGESQSEIASFIANSRERVNSDAS